MVKVDRVVRPKEAEGISGLSNMHMHRLEKAGKFPKRFKLVPESGKFGACGWMLSVLVAHNKKRAASIRNDPEGDNDAEAAIPTRLVAGQPAR